MPSIAKMKILHVESGRHFYGGPQQVVYLLEGLRRKGVENVLVCHPGSEINRQARAAGATVFNVASAGDLDVRFAWRLRRIVRRERPDVVHCHSRRGADFIGGLAAATTGVPAVLSRRVDNPEPGILARLRYRPYRKVVAISDNVAGVLREAGIRPERLTVIRSAVDASSFKAPPAREELLREFRLDDNAFVIASIGQLIARKGHRYLLQAMPAIARAVPGVRLLVFGQGPLGGELNQLAARLGLGENVQFAGFRGNLDRYMGAFDLVVHPALREGLGVSMLKAGAAGVAVVAFDIAGAREAVANGLTGILVPPGNTAALAKAVLTLAQDEGLRRAYAGAARERIQQEFSIEAMVGQHLELYETLVSDMRRDHRVA